MQGRDSHHLDSVGDANNHLAGVRALPGHLNEEHTSHESLDVGLLLPARVCEVGVLRALSDISGEARHATEESETTCHFVVPRNLCSLTSAYHRLVIVLRIANEVVTWPPVTRVAAGFRHVALFFPPKWSGLASTARWHPPLTRGVPGCPGGA